MSHSLQDQLVSLGLAKEKQKQPSRKKKARRSPGRKSGKPQAKAKAGDINLETAYKLRAKSERDARQAAGQKRQAEQKRRQKLNEKLDALIPPAAQNVEGAEESRYFNHRDRIKRVYVTKDQLEKINEGALAIAQHRGRYFIVSPETARQALEIKPDIFVFAESEEQVDPPLPEPEQDSA